MCPVEAGHWSASIAECTDDTRCHYNQKCCSTGMDGEGKKLCMNPGRGFIEVMRTPQKPGQI